MVNDKKLLKMQGKRSKAEAPGTLAGRKRGFIHSFPAEKERRTFL